MATRTSVSRRRRCFTPRARLPRSAFRWSGTCRRGSAIRSTRKACATEPNSSRAPSLAPGGRWSAVLPAHESCAAEHAMKLRNKVAVVTGGAHGIGLAIARRYVAEGARLLIADLDAAAGEAAAHALGAARFKAADVGDARQAAGVIEDARAAFGQVDILVNNAGIVHAADFLELAETDFDRVLRVNLKGAFLVGQAAALQMVAQVKAGGAAGTIINMSSVNAVLAIPNQVPYCVQKGGLAQLTKVMALSLASYGIRVNAIGPGSIMTDILKAVATDKEAKRRLLARTPLGRIGEPDEIASIAVFLASDDAAYVTGQTVYADGGRLGLNYTVPVKDEALGS